MKKIILGLAGLLISTQVFAEDNYISKFIERRGCYALPRIALVAGDQARLHKMQLQRVLPENQGLPSTILLGTRLEVEMNTFNKIKSAYLSERFNCGRYRREDIKGEGIGSLVVRERNFYSEIESLRGLSGYSHEQDQKFIKKDLLDQAILNLINAK